MHRNDFSQNQQLVFYDDGSHGGIFGLETEVTVFLVVGLDGSLIAYQRDHDLAVFGNVLFFDQDDIAVHNADANHTLALDLDGNELLKHQLSAGEQQMFAVAIVWALALTSGYKAPVIIDTPMARLDSSHRANFVTKYLPAASSQVMVLSTDEEVYGRYLDLVRDNVVDYYTLLYREEEQCTSIVHGYFGEV